MLQRFFGAKGRSYPRIHKVVELAALCVELREPLAPLNTLLKIVDEFYVPTRYPDAMPGNLSTGLPSEQDAREALAAAEAVLKIVEKTLAA